MPQQALTLRWMRAGRRYAIDSRYVARVLPCADITSFSLELMFANLEGLPALVVEPESFRVCGQTPDPSVGQPSARPAPAMVVVIGRRGVLQCGFAADHTDLFGVEPADDVLSEQEIRDFLDSL